MKQEVHKFNDKERTSKFEDNRIEQSVAEMEITSKRPGVALSKGKARNRSLLKHYAGQVVAQEAKNCQLSVRALVHFCPQAFLSGPARTLLRSSFVAVK